jgi:tetratricopeptide (TPR) repeat protein
LVGWDAADWKIISPLIENGEMPVLARFLEEGVMADIITLEPIQSPMLWNSIGTGKRADVHQILGFTEVSASGAVRPVASTSRRAKAIWNILSQQGLRTNVVGWFGSHPAEPIRGACVSDAYVRSIGQGPGAALMPGTVYPERLAQTLRGLRIHPAEVDSEIVRLFVPRLAEIDASKPNLIAPLCKVLAESFSVHAAATWLMEHEPWDFMAVYYIGIDHFSHGFMNFHPPRPEWVPEEQFDLYRDVVNSGYRLMDLFLARLLELAGPDTTVMILSDHGFHSDRLRPREVPDIPAGPCTQHRPLGIFAMKGEGIARDERIYGVSLLDIAPTVLSLFGLPAGEDMPGRVLAEAFDTPPPLDRIPSWESVAGESGMHAADFEMPEEDAGALVAQFVALGYVDEPKEDRAEAAADCERERQWNLARVYMSTWRYVEALPVLERIHDEKPERSDYALTLADCQRRLGLLEEAAATVETTISRHREMPLARYVLGNVAFERGRIAESLEHFRAAESAEVFIPELPMRIGFGYLKLRRWKDAERAFESALEIDPHNALTHQGLALSWMRQQRLEEAAHALLTSIGYQHDTPQSHYWLGVCLARLGNKERAIQAFETALSFQPPLRAAHRRLATLLGDSEKGRGHGKAAREFFQQRRRHASHLEELRREARHRAIDRAETRAEVRQERPTPAPPLSLTIVSGLPRSGTSLMMQMLSAAGVPVVTDSERKPDEDNPEGYYEWEPIKKVGRRPEILREAEGKVLKVVSMLLPALPACNRYKVLFMDRPIEEVVASQRKMVKNRGNESVADAEKLTRMLGEHRAEVLRGLSSAAAFELLVVDYPDLIRHPEKWVPRIVDFLGGVPDAAAMYGAIRPNLHRNRATPHVTEPR